MQTAANVRNYNVVIDAPPETVFDVVSDLRNMPRWAIHFCKGIRLTADGAIVTTPQGEVYFGITGDRDLGILDWWSGQSMQTAERWPTRVVGLADGRSLYNVTALLGASVPPGIDQWFTDELEALKRLVEEQLVTT
ncbi:MAG TPA: SRPBCC family protein [Gemmatimonadaceae bacterium]|jgi:hypothetical protein